MTIALLIATSCELECTCFLDPIGTATTDFRGHRPQMEQNKRNADAPWSGRPQYRRKPPLLRFAHTLVAPTMRRAGAVHGFGLGGVGHLRRAVALEIAMPVPFRSVMATCVRIGSWIRRTLTNTFLFGAKQFLEMCGRHFGAYRAASG